MGTNSKDSLAIIQNFINTWIKQKVVLVKAEENLENNKKDFQKELDEYKNSLIVYTYEKQLIQQKLDTAVSEQEIEKYYNENKNNFELKDNIVKVIYVKTIKNSPLNKTIRYLYKSEKEQDKIKLEDLCIKNAVSYFLDNEKWLYFNDLLKEVPVKTFDQEQYLKTNKFVEFQDSLYSYFLNIKGFRIKQGLSPLNLEKQNIKNIIITTRKINLIKKMEQDLYNDAVKRGDIKINTIKK